MQHFIIFLDVNGVLHACEWTIPGVSRADMAKLSMDDFSLLAGVRGWYAVPSESQFARLPLLESVIQPFLDDVQLVISSSWRKNPTKYEQLLQALSPDVRARVVGATPVQGMGRPREIYDWLTTHGSAETLPIVIDDDESHDWCRISDTVARIHPGSNGFSQQDAWLLEALLTLTSAQVQRLKAKLTYFNAMVSQAKLMELNNITLFGEQPWDLPCFADFEATGLSPNSHPIEIAWSVPSGDIRSYLIKPDEDWFGHWDPAAEAVHGIPREDLFHHGRPATEICAQMNADLSGQLLHFDGDLLDRNWLNQLFDAAEMQPTFQFADFYALLASLGTVTPARRQQVVEPVERELFSQPAHRAYRDTLRLQRWYLHAAHGVKG